MLLSRFLIYEQKRMRVKCFREKLNLDYEYPHMNMVFFSCLNVFLPDDEKLRIVLFFVFYIIHVK